MSSATATIMHEGTRNLIRCLEVLNEKLRKGMVERGEREELVCRFLILLGRDYTPEIPSISLASIPTVPFCRPVKLLDYLATTFGLYDPSQAVHDAFVNAYVNFLHWVRMKTNIQPPKRESSLSE